MADAVTSQTLFDGQKTAIMKFTNISDGTGETGVVKVDPAALASWNGATCTSVTITRIFADTDGMSVDILWDATTNALCYTVGTGHFVTYDFRDLGGLINNAGTGKTGKVKFSTIGAASGDRYTIVLEMIKNYI